MNNLFKRKNKATLIQKNKQLTENEEPNAKLSKEAHRLINESKEFEKSDAKTNKKIMVAAVCVAAASVLVSVGLIIVIASLLPLKTVEPYVIRVDNTTGYTDIVRPLENIGDEMPYQEAVSRHFLAQYILSRESHDWFMATPNYERVRVLSSDRVFTAYNNFIRSDQSPLEVLGRNRRAEVTITNITFIGEVAQVRFRKTVRNLDGSIDTSLPARNWIATINYDYIDKRMADSARLLNPLNFRVVGYQIAQESGESE